MDEQADMGPLSGILSAMEWAKNLGFDRVLTSPADTPFLPDNWAKKLMQTSANTIAIAKSQGRQHRVSALWPVDLNTALRDFLTSAKNPKVGVFIDAHTWKSIEFSEQAGLDPFFNINRVADLERARTFIKD